MPIELLAASSISIAFNTLVLLLSIAGFMALLRLALDWLSLRANTISQWRNMVVLAWILWLTIAASIVAGLGFGGPMILRQGSLSDVPLYGWPPILVGVFATIISLFFWFRRLMHEDPKALVSRVPRELPLHPDLRKPKDDRSGLSDILAMLPGNKIFELKIIEEQVRLTRLPKDWEGLSILHLSDLHLAYTPNRPYFERVMELAAELSPDIIILTGDIIGKQARIRWIPGILGQIKAPLGKYYVLGDHDYSLDREKIRDVMEMSGWVDVGHSYVLAPVRGKNLLIMGTQQPWGKRHTPMPVGPKIHMSIALSHYPNHLEWACGRNFDLLLTGHPTGGVSNLPWPGLIGPSAKAPGLHYRAPTLMNVSHGMSRAWSMAYGQGPAMTLMVLHGPNPADNKTERLALDETPVQETEASKRAATRTEPISVEERREQAQRDALARSRKEHDRKDLLDID